MSWKEKVKGQATFRDVPFWLESSERSGGRRTVKHEYPKKDEPFSEDMGRKGREFPVEGHVVGGDDYMTARDALIEALEKAGTGVLVHPYFGTLRVIVADFRVRESSDRGGIATFSITFVETPDKPAQPSAIPNAASAVAISAAAAKLSAGAEFLAKFTTVAGAFLTSASSALSSATRTMNTVAGKIAMPAQALAQLQFRIAKFEDSAAALLAAPEDLLSSLSTLVDSFESGLAVLAIYDFDPGLRPPGTTSHRITEQDNFDALHQLIQRLALVRAVELSVTETFDSYDTSIARRVILTDLIDSQAELAADDTFPALLQLRADLTKAVPGVDGDLPRLISYTPPVTVSSLVLAYRLYGALDLEADLIARNRVSHPGFIAGGRTLEVLSNV